jgi:hypothetical protein
MKPIVIGAIVVVVLILMSSAAMVMTNRPKKQALVTKPKTTKAPRTPAPSTTPPATTAPAKTTSTTVVYPDYAAGIIAPLPTPSFILVPGANFPGLLGIKRDEASTYIITRYPRLVVRAIPLGTQVTYDVRSDRVTLSYDPYTNRVVNARIG